MAGVPDQLYGLVLGETKGSVNTEKTGITNTKGLVCVCGSWAEISRDRFEPEVVQNDLRVQDAIGGIVDVERELE